MEVCTCVYMCLCMCERVWCFGARLWDEYVSMYYMYRWLFRGGVNVAVHRRGVYVCMYVCIAFGARWVACLMRSGVNQDIWGGLKIGLGFTDIRSSC